MERPDHKEDGRRAGQNTKDFLEWIEEVRMKINEGEVPPKGWLMFVRPTALNSSPKPA